MTVAAIAVHHLLRDLAPRLVAAVARRHENFAAAEDAVQEALIAAAATWPVEGVPDNPKGWLYRVALRRLTDEIRSDQARRVREDTVAREQEADLPCTSGGDEVDGIDETLTLLFMCCHPALSVPSSIALTLRAVGGLTTAEIARAFLVPESTMAQRISRAKQAIRSSGVSFVMPEGGERIERLDAVCHVLYLVFSEGYISSEGPVLQRTDLADEAIRLARLLRNLLPGDATAAGLLALMLLNDARRAARSGLHGELIPLDEQDRTVWDRGRIAEGIALVEEALSGSRPTSYGIQAAIAALHDDASSTATTDWTQILALYEVLDAMAENPMVTLNRAIAAAMVHGPAAGLVMLEVLDGDSRMRGHYRLAAVRGHLLQMAGERILAIAEFRKAADGTASRPERDYLLTKAARLAEGV